MNKTQIAMKEGLDFFASSVDLSNKDTAHWSAWLKSHQKHLITAVLEDRLEEVVMKQELQKVSNKNRVILSNAKISGYNQALKHQAQIIREKIKEL